MNIDLEIRQFPNIAQANRWADNHMRRIRDNIVKKNRILTSDRSKTTDDIQELKENYIKKEGRVPTLEQFTQDWKIPNRLKKSKSMTKLNIENAENDILDDAFDLHYASITDLEKKWNVRIRKTQTLDDLEKRRKEFMKKYGYIPKPEKLNYYKECQICFTNPVGNFLRCDCKMFCRECIGKSFESQVDLQGTNITFKCPNKECNRVVDQNLAFQYTTQEFNDKFQEWRRKQGEKIDVEANTITKLWKWWNCKKCPNCNVYTQKLDGCDTMTCYWCNATWCWKCRTQRPPYEIHDCVPSRTSNKYINKLLSIFDIFYGYLGCFSCLLFMIFQIKLALNTKIYYIDIILPGIYSYYRLKKFTKDPFYQSIMNILRLNKIAEMVVMSFVWLYYCLIHKYLFISMFLCAHPILSFSEIYRNFYNLQTINDHRQFLYKLFI